MDYNSNGPLSYGAVILAQLTSSNLEVKKFVAFQEGFERLFDIMSDEGMLEGGGVIVKDCIDICINLLTGSPLTRVSLGLGGGRL